MADITPQVCNAVCLLLFMRYSQDLNYKRKKVQGHSITDYGTPSYLQNHWLKNKKPSRDGRR